MKGRGGSITTRDYGWLDAEQDLGAGIHPEVVAARLGEPIEYLLEVADERRWPICWQPHATVESAIARHARLLGLDS